MMSQEFKIGMDLIRRFREILEGIAKASSPQEAKPLIESIKHPIFGAMAQIKVGEGPLKEELLRSLAVVVRNFRKLEDFTALKSAIQEVLNLTAQVEELSQEGAQKEG